MAIGGFSQISVECKEELTLGVSNNYGPLWTYVEMKVAEWT
ncbi:hypothetical protein CUZ56_01396 [Saezia sanguinis]|uniref:Uncharacterized protein n=1 Tax=Saezia sanguinis TaxID=1965230 RepID=A0A433SFC7_9BURK|nr:hypothetical protein CUZ56_01396 [Saezia sanguinis]